MPSCIANRQFRALAHSPTLVSVSDPPPAPGVWNVSSVLQLRQYRLEDAREGKVGLKGTCVFSIPLPALGGLGVEVCERGEVSSSGD